jgi:hypothetical protein
MWEGANSGSRSWKIRGESIHYASLLFSTQGAFFIWLIGLLVDWVDWVD